MKKGISILLILFVFSFIALQGTAQLTSNSNALQSNKVFVANSLTLNYDGFPKDIVLSSNANLVSSEILRQNHFLPKLYMNFSESNGFPGIIPSKEYSVVYQTNAKNVKMNTSFFNSENYNKSRRLIYSSLWTFTSLNYLYCDLAAFMDADMHTQYHTGTVDGFEMTPGFIAASSAFMQIAIANVFLPQVIKDDRTLRWVQIASGAVMTIVQSATLFAGKPTPYYAVFSGFEIAATAYITFDAIKWKPKRPSVKN